MTKPLLTCSLCGKPVSLEDAKTDAVGKAVHEDCYTGLITNRPEYVAISPITLTCPRCHVEPGETCEVLPEAGLEIVHIERIELALSMDVAAKARLARGRLTSQ